jgi:phosphodiesterase/alkaline phosphatase D-like protein
MAISFWWLGHATTTTARVCVRTTTTGTVTVSCAGQSFTAAADTAVADGTVAIDVLGLEPGKSYPVTITDAAPATERGTLRTMPAAGGKVAFLSCDERVRPLDDLAQNIIAFGADALVHQGDYIYCATVLSGYNGETTTLPDKSSAASVYAAHWRQCMRKSDKRLLETAIPQYRMWDDHEFGGDNWDHTITQANTALNLGCATQAEVDAAWWAARQAAGWYAAGNPAADAGTTAEKPSNAAAGTSVNQYPVAYYRNTVGDMEYVHIDCFSYRSPNAATDNASKTMLGANQKAWLKARLAASTAKFKIIASGKTTYIAATGGTGDDWTRFSTERDELIAFVQSAGITGVVWMCGDPHSAFVAYDPARGHIAVTANPAGVDHLAQTAGYLPFVVWKQQGDAGGQTRLPAVFGLCEASGNALTIRLIDQYGAELWRGTVAAGTNVLTT